MSFSSLRQNSTIYILNKEGLPQVDQGLIVSVSAPTPKYGNQQPFPMQFGQQPEMVVDLTVKVADKTGMFNKVPSMQDVYDYTPTMMITTSKEVIGSELSAIRQRSLDIVNSIEHNKQVIERCDALIADLNPEIAEKRAQAQEIADLKRQMSELMAMNKDLMTALQMSNNEPKGKKQQS